MALMATRKQPTAKVKRAQIKNAEKIKKTKPPSRKDLIKKIINSPGMRVNKHAVGYVGRKSTQDKVLKLAKLGLTDTQIAQTIGFSQAAISNVLKKIPEFDDKLAAIRGDIAEHRLRRIQAVKDGVWRNLELSIKKTEEKLANEKLKNMEPDRIALNMGRVGERVDSELAERKQVHVQVTEDLDEDAKQALNNI